ncbi:MAG TPA: hypothetical protein VGJ94_00420 [Syntrophorhabdaceae bacterium]|jgi:hypothetical protein
MEEIAKVEIKEFQKNPDGSWVCIKNSDITTKSGRVIRVSPGTTFRPGGKVSGLEVAKALDEVSGQ